MKRKQTGYKVFLMDFLKSQKKRVEAKSRIKNGAEGDFFWKY